MLADFVAHGLHFGGSVGVARPLGCGETGVEAGAGFVDAGDFDQRLRGHLIGGDVVGVVVDEGAEFSECSGGIALRGVLHRETVTREGVAWVELEDLVECGDLVHTAILEDKATTDLHG